MDRSRAMITRADADKLRGLRAPGSAVLSLYLSIPVDLAEHRGAAGQDPRSGAGSGYRAAGCAAGIPRLT